MRSRLSNRSVEWGVRRLFLPCVVLRTAIGELDGSHGYIGSIGWKIPAEREFLVMITLIKIYWFKRPLWSPKKVQWLTRLAFSGMSFEQRSRGGCWARSCRRRARPLPSWRWGCWGPPFRRRRRRPSWWRTWRCRREGGFSCVEKNSDLSR